MAYKTEELEAQALKAIADNNLFFFNDLSAYMACDRATMYNHKLDKLDTIKDALENNRLKTKNGLRSKWYKSDNATMTVALYKLLADDTERKMLSQQYTDITSGGEKLKGATIEFANPDIEAEDPDTSVS